MAKLQHTFIKGKMNKDLDERLIPNGEYRDALNVQVSTSEGADVGAVENILGNTKLNKKTNAVNWDPKFGLTNPVCIGTAIDSQNNKVYWFLASDAGVKPQSVILEFDQLTGFIAPILVDKDNVINFTKANLITGINILGGLLFFTDNTSEPKVINIDRFKTGSQQTGTIIATQTIVHTRSMELDDVTVIKISPKQPVAITALPSLVLTTSNRGTGITPIFISENLGLLPPLVGSKPIGSTFTITGGFSGFLAPSSVFLNNKVRLNASAIQDDGSELYYEVICTVKALTAGEQPNQFDGGTFEINSITADVPYAWLNWSIVLVESDPIFSNIFPRFSYRYKFNDNEYSTYAPFSKVAFVPGQFDYTGALSFNKGMVNNLRKITLTFPTDTYALPPDDAIEIEILFKGSDSNNIYVIDNHLISSGTLTTFDITSEILGPVVESVQLLRPFDAVPRKAKAQEVIGNRIVYGNYLQNYTLGGIPILTGNQNNTAFTNNEQFLGKESIKSNRTYQIGVSFIDIYNRESPVFTNKEASVIISKDKSLNKNFLTAATALASVPSWAEYYKYYIKDSAPEYYNVVLDRWYDAEDGNAWLSFPSNEINKIRENGNIFLKKQHGTDIAVVETNKYKILDIKNEAPNFIKLEQTEFATCIAETVLNGFTANGPFIGFKGPMNSQNISFHDGFSGTGAIQFIEALPPNRVSQLYKIKTGGPQDDTPPANPVNTNYSVNFDSGVGIIPADQWLIALLPGADVKVVLYELRESSRPEFAGRFFVKVPKNSSFINNIEAPSSTSLIQQGFNANVIAGSRKNSVFNDMPAAASIFLDFLSFGDTNSGQNPTGPVAINTPNPVANTNGNFTLVYGPVDVSPIGTIGKQNFRVYQKATLFPFPKIRFEGENNNFSEVYNITGVTNQQGYTRAGKTFVYRTITVDRPFVGEFGPQATTIKRIEIVTDSLPDHFTTPNPAIFETEPIELTDLDIFYEASEAKLIAGLANTVTLDYFNTYSFGNGVESDRIEDDFNTQVIGKGVRVSSTLAIPYEEERIESGMIFSGIFNSISGVNNTNQFLIAEKITKNLNSTYGSIQKLYARDTDLVVLMEDKCFRVLANKDALFNADGSSNVASSNQVLGSVTPFIGEFGISKNPESFASFGFRSYFVDKARGAVMRLSRDGLTKISSSGMSDYFIDNLKLNTTGDIIGSYNSDAGSYNLLINVPDVRVNPGENPPVITNSTESVSFKEKVNGWTTTMSYIPEAAISLNNEYYSFKDGELYNHTEFTDAATPIAVPRTNFYGVQYKATVTPIINDAPTSVKKFKTLAYEGTEGWAAEIETDQQNGLVSTFVKKEGSFYNYIQGVATTVANLDTQEFSTQGLGNLLSHDPGSAILVINGKINVSLKDSAGTPVSPEFIAPDIIYTMVPGNVLRALGEVLAVDRITNTIRLRAAIPAASAPQSGNFLFFGKNTKINTSGIIGYFAKTKMTTSATTKQELFSISSEVFISSE